MVEGPRLEHRGHRAQAKYFGHSACARVALLTILKYEAKFTWSWLVKSG